MVVAAALEKQLERAVESSRSIENRASLVIPAIGAAVGLLASDVGVKFAAGFEDQAGPFWFGIGVLLAAIFAVIAALLALSPRARSNGPQPLLAVMGRAEPETTSLGHYVIALGFAVQSSEDLVRIQGFCLNGSLRGVGIAIAMIIGFGATGGFAA